jgi:glycosyltransferase involved in cell wall biosynthesis
MKFFCVTPCLNAEKYIEETMLSVLKQVVFESLQFSLQYVVIDGGSGDSTVKIIETVIAQFSEAKNIQVAYFSEKDSGMYDALVKGFKYEINQSDVYSYINAGDYYSKHAFEIVSEVFGKNDVHFLTGINTIYNKKSHLTNFYMPFLYSKKNIISGFHGKILPCVQQESTFWTRKLHTKINFEKLRSLRFAGDFYLWKTFIQFEPLYIVRAWLGGFKVHDGQLSSNFVEEYHAELGSISQKPTIVDYIFAYAHKILWCLPDKVKQKLSFHLFVYDNVNQEYRLTKHIFSGLLQRRPQSQTLKSR